MATASTGTAPGDTPVHSLLKARAALQIWAQTVGLMGKCPGIMLDCLFSQDLGHSEFVFA